MFKFVESKVFFYLSAFMSVICVASSIKYSNDTSHVLQTVFLCTIIIAMMIFYNRENKELMKALLVTFITTVFLFTAIDSAEVIFTLPMRFQQYNLRSPQDPIRVVVSSVTLVATPTMLLLLFINHFIINFNGEASKVFININKAIVLIMLFGLIFDKTSVLVASTLNGNELLIIPSEMLLFVVFKYVNVIFYAFTIVSAEAFINTQRELKAKKK